MIRFGPEGYGRRGPQPALFEHIRDVRGVYGKILDLQVAAERSSSSI
jgi:hypothetical protein